MLCEAHLAAVDEDHQHIQDRLALKWRNRRPIDASPASFAASSRFSLIRVTSRWEMK
jgi:hypothetical protein